MSVNDVTDKNQMAVRFAGVCGILGSVFPLIMILSATFLSLWFRWDTNALSELGVGEQALLFNSAVLLGGLLSFLFALGLRQYLDKGKSISAGAVSIMIGSVCLALVGIFTINDIVMHSIVALSYLVLVPVGFLLIGSGTKGSAVQGLSFACGIVALLAILVIPVIIVALPFKVGFAVPELIEGLTISSWMVFMSVKLLRPSR